MNARLLGALALAAGCLWVVGSYVLRSRGAEVQRAAAAEDALEAAGALPGAGGVGPGDARAARAEAAPEELGEGAPAASDTETARAPALLRGAVVDGRDAPVAGAEVVAFAAPGATWLNPFEAERARAGATESDAQGGFALELEPARAHELEVRAAGYAPALLTELTGGMDVRVVLARAAALRGTVVDARDGAPVAGGAVRVFHGAWTVEVPVGTGGRFALDELVPGEVGLLALPERHDVPRYRAEEVAPGGTLEVTLEVEPGLVVEGRVTDARTGAAVAGAELVAGRGAWKRTTSGADGRYRLEGVEPVRPEVLLVSAAGYADAQLPVDPARADAFDVALEPGVAVVGRVVDSGGDPVARGRAIAWTSGMLEGGGERAGHWGAVGAGGAFRIEGLDPALAYGLVVRSPGFATAFLPLPPDPGAAGERDLGELALLPAATIAGEVRDPDGRGVAALLELWPAAGEPGSRTGHGMRATRTDARGVFALGDLGPGRYVLRVVAQGHPPLDGFELELAPGEARNDLLVELPGGRAIRGLVRDAAGTPVPDVYVQARPVETVGRGSYSRGTTDARGWFELTDLPAVAHSLSLAYGGEWTLDGAPVALDSLTVEPVEPGANPLELVLPALDARVTGRVVDAAGEPVARAWVYREREGQGFAAGVLCDAAGRFELAVPSAAPVTLVARRTRHLSEGDDTMTLTEFRMGRDVAPAELGEARLTGVAPGARELELALRP